jgi:hypothetical protein
MKPMKQILALAVPAFALTTASGCNPTPAYYDGFEVLEITAADLDPETAHPAIGNWVQTEFWLDYAPPTAAQLDALGPADGEPAERDPWIRADSVDLAVQWRLVNESDDAPLRAWVLLDGATEFYDWNPVAMYGMGGGEDADEVPFPSLLGYYPLELAPGEVLTGEFREDDTSEAVFDLDVMTRFCGGPFALLYNRHEVDPVGTEYLPAQARRAGLGMLRLTLGADGPAKLDYSLRVRDGDEVLFDAHRDDARYDFTPAPYVPAGFAQVPAGQADPGMLSMFCMTMTGTGGP